MSTKYFTLTAAQAMPLIGMKLPYADGALWMVNARFKNQKENIL